MQYNKSHAKSHSQPPVKNCKQAEEKNLTLVHNVFLNGVKRMCKWSIYSVFKIILINPNEIQ